MAVAAAAAAAVVVFHQMHSLPPPRALVRPLRSCAHRTASPAPAFVPSAHGPATPRSAPAPRSACGGPVVTGRCRRRPAPPVWASSQPPRPAAAARRRRPPGAASVAAPGQGRPRRRAICQGCVFRFNSLVVRIHAPSPESLQLARTSCMHIPAEQRRRRIHQICPPQRVAVGGVGVEHMPSFRPTL